MLGKFLLGSAVLGALLLAPVVSHAEDEGNVNINERDDLTILSEEDVIEALDELEEKYDFSYELGDIQNYNSNSTDEEFTLESVEELESIILETQNNDTRNDLTLEYFEDDYGLLNTGRTYVTGWWSFLDVVYEGDYMGQYTTFREIQFTGNQTSTGVLSNINIVDASVRGISVLKWTMDGSQPVTYNSDNTEATLEVYGTYEVSGVLGLLPLHANWYGDFSTTIDGETMDGISVEDPIDPPF